MRLSAVRRTSIILALLFLHSLPARFAPAWSEQADPVALAKFAQGVRDFQRKNWQAAINSLSDRRIESDTPVSDRALHLLAQAKLSLGREQEAISDWEKLLEKWPDSVSRSEARRQVVAIHAQNGRSAQALRILERDVSKGEPDAMLASAGFQERLGQTDQAIRLYRSLLLNSPVSREAYDAQNRLMALRVALIDRSSTPYPKAVRAAQQLYLAEAYERAAYMAGAIMDNYPQAEVDEQLVLSRISSLYRSGRARQAKGELDRRNFTTAESQAQALWLRVEDSRSADQVAKWQSLTRNLVSRFPKTEWAARALAAIASHHWKRDQTADAIASWKELVQLQPRSPFASEASFRLGRYFYQQREYRKTAEYLTLHLDNFPGSDYFGAALYWTGRAEQRSGDREDALACFRSVVARYPSGYYAQQSEQRILELAAADKNLPSSSPVIDGRLAKILKEIPAVKPEKVTTPPDARVHLRRSAAYHQIALDDWALEEIQAAVVIAPQAHEVNLALARLLDAHGEHLAAIGALKRSHPEYLSYRDDALESETWKLLFPLERWETIKAEAQRRGLDPYLVAGLIRQESGFNVQARSRANARGLMQLLPSTGRLVARTYGIRRVTADQLYHPELNIRLGVQYFADLVRQFGKTERALAAYNGGPNRVARLVAQSPDLETDEWVDSIPITETRLYVQGVLRNTARYRRIYTEPAR